MSNNKLNIPWNKYALITYLAKSLQNKPAQFGKTALQKMVYLFQTIYQTDCGYDFEFYTYGPFTSRLMDDLDFTEHIGGVKICSVDTGKGGYEIVPGNDAEDILKRGNEFFSPPDIEDKFRRLLDNFGSFSATELELRSTIVYVDRDLQVRHSRSSEEEIVDLVKEIKPKFSPEEIQLAVEELEKKGFICKDR